MQIEKEQLINIQKTINFKLNSTASMGCETDVLQPGCPNFNTCGTTFSSQKLMSYLKTEERAAFQMVVCV